MKLNTILTLSMTTLSTVSASPAPQPVHQTRAPFPLFYLKVNATHEPWHNRHIIQLPSTHHLGLENFTVHPETPPLLFTPVKLPSGDFALRGAYTGDDLTKTPWIAALIPGSGSEDRNIAMTTIRASEPSEENVEEEEACPEGYECSTDQWTFITVSNSGFDFKYTGFQGAFEPVKDAGEEGWHVYWKSNATSTGIDGDGDERVFHPVQLDIVAYKGRN